MDVALALWQINPAAEYRLDHAHGDAIVEWRGPGEQPTADDLAAAWAAYQDPATRRQEGPPPTPSLNDQLAAALAALPADTPITGAQLAGVIALLRQG